MQRDCCVVLSHRWGGGGVSVRRGFLGTPAAYRIAPVCMGSTPGCGRHVTLAWLLWRKGLVRRQGGGVLGFGRPLVGKAVCKGMLWW